MAMSWSLRVPVSNGQVSRDVEHFVHAESFKVAVGLIRRYGVPELFTMGHHLAPGWSSSLAMLRQLGNGRFTVQPWSIPQMGRRD